MKKVLFTATVLKGHILKFHLPYLKLFKNYGFEVWVCAFNDTGIVDKDIIIPNCDYYINIPFERNPFKYGNIKAYKKLKKLIEIEKFDVIHCHTPVGGILTRLAAKNCDYKKTIIYTAHGFHFYKGSPYINWLVFYPIEKLFSKYTDILITINKEDYNLAKNKFYMKKLYLVNGVGVDFSGRFSEGKNIRKELGFNENDYVIISIGELNKNKNHKIIIDTINCEELKDVKYIIAGDGDLKDYYDNYIYVNKLSDRVKLLGFRIDILDLLQSSDLFVFPSLREGLPVSIMEAQYCGLPCVVSDIRGNRDLINNNNGGFLCNNKIQEYKKRIIEIYSDKKLADKFKNDNLKNSNKNTIEEVVKEYDRIYKSVL